MTTRTQSRELLQRQIALASAARPAATRPEPNAKSRRLMERMARRGPSALSGFASMREAWGIMKGFKPGIATLQAFSALCRSKSAFHVLKDQVPLLKSELAQAQPMPAMPAKVVAASVAIAKTPTVTADELAVQAFCEFQEVRKGGAAAAMTFWLANKSLVESGRKLVLADLDSEIAKASPENRAELLKTRAQFQN